MSYQHEDIQKNMNRKINIKKDKKDESSALVC